MRHPNHLRCRAFTLVELLVVIGIIALLASILVPVISKVQISGRSANTKSRLMQISMAINNYHQDQGAYPGPTPPQAFAPTPPPGHVKVVDKLTGCEDLVLALVGGIGVTAYGPPLTLTFDKNLVGSGPTLLNPLNRGNRPAYYPNRPEELSDGQLSNDPAFGYMGANTDSPVPELMDAYSDRKPILYLRANPAARQGVDEKKLVSSTFKSDTHYNLGSVAPYLNKNSTPPDEFTKEKSAGAYDAVVYSYFKSTFSTDTAVTAKNAGSYMLISAGPDRRYGSDDDIVVGGSGAQ